MEELLVRWLRLAALRIADQRERLTALDAAIGDGDHGINLDRGFRELLRRLDDGAFPTDPPFAALDAAGRILMSTVGGASGALYGRAFQRAGAALGTASEEGLTSREALAGVAFAGAVGAIAALGRSRPGEKTMLDALVPAQHAFAAAVDAGDGLAEATARAAGAGEEGALATIPLLATKGRASYLGERSIGHMDPGASSSALLLRALADVTAGD
jgi:dihydroxyacetone kinase phosphoprotein-dependent L subunit